MASELTPLIAIFRLAPPRERYHHVVVRRFLAFALGLTLILVVFFVLFPRPVVATQICHSSLRTSRAYVSAEALSNNIDDFCLDVTNKEPLITIGWTWSKIYYRNTPEEYAMTVTISNRAFSSYQNQCIDAMRSIINGCDVPVNGSNPMNWKQGGKRVQGVYTYRIDIFRQNRPWPPPTQPKQSCEGWYKIIWQHYDIYGAGWANYDGGAKSLLPAINPCCGLGSLTGWNFEYFDQPDENGYEWHSWFNTTIGTRRRCFDNNSIQCAAGGPFEGIGSDGDNKYPPIADEGVTKNVLFQPRGGPSNADEGTNVPSSLDLDRLDEPPPYSHSEGQPDVRGSGLVPAATMTGLKAQLMSLHPPSSELRIWEQILEQAHEWQFWLAEKLMGWNPSSSELRVWKQILEQAHEWQFELVAQLIRQNPSSSELAQWIGQLN